MYYEFCVSMSRNILYKTTWVEKMTHDKSDMAHSDRKDEDVLSV